MADYAQRKAGAKPAAADGYAEHRAAERHEALERRPQQSRDAAYAGLLDGRARAPNPVQTAERRNRTGLPDAVKNGVEALSGLSLDGVTVHYGSTEPRRMHARAYTQGLEIHVAPGQERHLAHEAWHVVQQAQGRVKAPRAGKAGLPPINSDPSLEREADVMGARAAQLRADPQHPLETTALVPGNVAQRLPLEDIAEGAILLDEQKHRYRVHAIVDGVVKLVSLVDGSSRDYEPQWDDDWEVEESGSSASARPASPAPVPEVQASASAPPHREQARLEERKEESASSLEAEQPSSAKDRYPYLKPFTYALPANLGQLEWVKDEQFYTEDGWMSRNLHLTPEQSRQLQGEGQEVQLFSLHAIIAVKDIGNVVRLNPHVTVRDQGRQIAREQRVAARLSKKKGFHVPKPTKQEREEDALDAEYSAQLGLNAPRPSELVKTRDLAEIFTPEWIKGIADKAAQAAAGGGRSFQVGNARHQFPAPKAE